MKKFLLIAAIIIGGFIVLCLMSEEKTEVTHHDSVIGNEVDVTSTPSYVDDEYQQELDYNSQTNNY